MFIMARLTSSTTLEYLSELYTALCITCFSKVRYPETVQYINKLKMQYLLLSVFASAVGSALSAALH